MRYIHFYGSAGYCGTDYHDFQVFDEDTEDYELNQISEDIAYDCAQSYSYLHTGWEGDFENEEDEEMYYEDAMGYCGWAELSKQEWEDLKEQYT